NVLIWDRLLVRHAMHAIPLRGRTAMGRDGFPWYQNDKACWYVWRLGQCVRLHRDKAEAFRLWHRLEAGIDGQAPTGPTVGEISDVYLAHAESRFKPSTLQSKRKVLLQLKADKGECRAVTLSSIAVASWLDRPSWGRSVRWLRACIIKTCFRWAVAENLL